MALENMSEPNDSSDHRELPATKEEEEVPSASMERGTEVLIKSAPSM
jgi:hypothetical protein